MKKIILITIMLLTTSIFASIADDASADHNILTPTAQTIKEGEMTFNSYELFFAGMSYGIQDNLQLTGTVLIPMFSNMPFVGLFTAKYQIMSDESSAFTIQPGIFIMHYDGNSAGAISLSAIFDLYLNEDATLTFSGVGYKPFASVDGEDSKLPDFYVITLTGAFNYRFHDFMKFIVELNVMGGGADGDFKMLSESTTVNYGIKFFNKDLSALLSFLRPLNGDSTFLMGFPYVTFTAKF